MVKKINDLIDKILTKLHLMKFREQLLYIAVGGMTTVIDWGVFALLERLLPPLSDGGFMQFLFRLSPYIIQYTVAWCAAVLFAYWASKYFVFECSGGNAKKQFVEFVLSRLLSLGISLVFDVVLSGEKVGINMNPYIAKLISSVVVIIVNYITNKWVVFRKKKETAEEKND